MRRLSTQSSRFKAAIIMYVAQVQFAPWDKSYNFAVRDDLNLQVGDQVVVKTSLGTEVGKVISLFKSPKDELPEEAQESKSILRKVTTEDLNILSAHQKQRPAAMEYCKEAVERHNLPMKIVDVHFSFDGGRLTFVFIADGRVDFRDLVKDLTHHFQKSIRLQQIGIRDEAKMAGDVGPCGRKLCCKSHLKELRSITSETAELQQIAHRGSDRLSGICGRLRCCLAYEKELYQELSKNLPPIGSIIKTPQGKGEIINWHILRQTVDVALQGDERNIIEVPVNPRK